MPAAAWLLLLLLLLLQFPFFLQAFVHLGLLQQHVCLPAAVAAAAIFVRLGGF